MRGAAMRLGRNAVCTVAFGGLVLVGGAACADESAADAIAEKFSRAAEDSERREAEAKKAEAERASMAARKLEARRKAAAERKAAEQRKAEAAALHRLTEERKAREARLAAAARVAKEEEKRLVKERQAEEARKADAAHAQLDASRSEAPPYIADKFKRAFERGRSAWLNAQ
jgi:colicin import membrane protein